MRFPPINLPHWIQLMFYHHITGIRCSQIHSVRAVEEGWPTTETLSPSSRNLDCVGPGPGSSQVGTLSQDKLLSILLSSPSLVVFCIAGLLWRESGRRGSLSRELIQNSGGSSKVVKTVTPSKIRLKIWNTLKLVLLGSSCSSRTRLNHKIWWSF